MSLSGSKFFMVWVTMAQVANWSLLSCHLLAATNESRVDAAFVCRAWRTEDGLPQNTVSVMLQTRDGYLWLGTQAGLARFDGLRFKVFGLAEGLPNVQVRALCEDSAGDLWIGTQGGGVARLRAGRIERFRAGVAGVSGDENIAALAPGARGRIWIGTAEGLIFWENGKFFRDESLGKAGHDSVRALLRGRDGTMWISFYGGLFAYKDGGLVPATGPAPDATFSPYCLLEDRTGKVWASIGNGKVLCREDGIWKRYDESSGLPFAYVTSLAESEDGRVWAGSLDAGLYFFEDEKFNKLTTHDGLSENAIRSLLPDREGNMWVGHRTTGLDRLALRKLAVLGAQQGLTNDYVRSVGQTTDGKLWVGTTGGGLYHEQDGVLRLFTNVVFNGAYPFVEAVTGASDGSLWWGGAGSLFRWKEGRVEEAYTGGDFAGIANQVHPEWLANNASVTAILEAPGTGMWIGTSRGTVLELRDCKAQVITNQLGHGTVTSFALEPDGTLWVGSSAGGLSRWRQGVVTTYSAANGLSCNFVRTLYRSRDGVLWAGTGGGGLLRCKEGKIKSISAHQGVGDDTVSQILEDDRGFLWLGCNRGIFRVLRQELDELAEGRRAFVHPQAFGLNAGMLAEECSGGSSPAGCKLKDGRLCFSTVKGVVTVDPRFQEVDAKAPAVLLEEVRADRSVVEMQIVDELAEGGPLYEVTIPPGRRECEFHYTGLSFKAPERVRFRFQLEGVDKDWVEADTRRVAYYNPLRPGNYVFRVIACNADGVWSEAGANMAVTVQPYVWETRWFWTAAGLLVTGVLAGTVYLAARRRYKRRLGQLETQHAIERERLRISQDMHDHIGSILTRVSILSDVGQGEGNGESAPQQFERIGNQVRAAVVALDEIVWATNPSDDNLPRFAEYVGRFADECFENTTVRCWQEMPTDLPNLALRADMRHNIFLAVKEALNNVLKHSGATEVWLRLTLVNSTVCLEVEDNGCGFNPDTVTPSGNGLGNMKSRLAECGGRMTLASTPTHGTKIQFVFPLPGNA
jgi:ligand-binding sensor domain-containing protein/signal transduction histidine kinase